MCVANMELQFSNKFIVLGLLYRPPNADSNSNRNWLTQMGGMLLAAYSENKPTVLTGDLNIDLRKHNSNPLRTNWQSLYENFELTLTTCFLLSGYDQNQLRAL